MMSFVFAFIAVVFFVVILVLLGLLYWVYSSKPKQPSGESVGEVKGMDISEAGSELKKWDCSAKNRQIVFSNVPAGLTPYLVPINESDLRSQKLEGFSVLLSIAADVRFRDASGREVEKFDSTVTLWLSYSAEDLLALRRTDFNVSDLVPVKIVPGQTNWRPFDPEKIDYSNMECGEFGGVSIKVDSWGDPPIGWGSPK